MANTPNPNITTPASKYIPGLGDAFFVQAAEIGFQIANQPHSTAVDIAHLLADFNALLDKLVAAGIMKAQ